MPRWVYSNVTLLVTAVALQSSSGGNLGEVLSNLSKVLRDRFQLRRKVRALSAEGRFSANVEVTTPTTELVLVAGGKPADDEAFPQVQISTTRTGAPERTFVTKKLDLMGWNSYPETVLPCKLSPGQYTVDIDFLNGDKWPVPSDTYQRRTVSIKALRLR